MEMWKNDGSIDVSTWMIQDSLKYVERRHKQKISKNQTPDKEEAEADKSWHQTSVLKRKNSQESMDEVNIYLTCSLLEEKKNFQHLPTGTFHLLHNYVMTKYDLHKI